MKLDPISKNIYAVTGEFLKKNELPICNKLDGFDLKIIYDKNTNRSNFIG